MAYVIIENFNGGWDTRRLESAGTPGTLLELVNAHVTRGGEIEKRKAFVEEYDLPASVTKGLAATPGKLWVFGDGTTPVGLPAGVDYQRLVHPTNPVGTTLSEILSWDTYAGKLYVAALFSDGSVHHFYDGNYVENWWDGKARGSFVIESCAPQTGDESQCIVGLLENDGQALTVEAFMSDPDGENEVSLTGGTVSIASTDGSNAYGNKIASAVNNNTGTTGVTASNSFGILNLFADTFEKNLKDYQVWFTVDVGAGSGFTPNLSSDKAGKSCVSPDVCTNWFYLSASPSGGTSPYTYAWSIEDDGGASHVIFEDTQDITSTQQNPRLNVTNQCTAAGRITAVTVKCVVTDDTTATATEFITVVSSHWSTRGEIA